jgi:hypothetical protein
MMPFRFMVLFLAALFVSPVMVGCGNPADKFPDMSMKGDIEPGSSRLAVADHGVRQGGCVVTHSLGYLVYLAVILAIPWVAILLIPGVIAGEWEMKIESALIIFASATIWFGSSTFRDLGLGWWLLVIDVIPAIIIIFWTSERLKILLFGIPTGICVVYHALSFIMGITDHVILNPATVLVCILVAALLYYLVIRKETAAA